MTETLPEPTTADADAGPAVVHVPAGQGRTLWVMDGVYTIKASAETTGGRLGFVEATVPPGGGPPPHIHGREAEAFYILSGEFEVLDRDRPVRVGPGDFVYVPQGTLHRFRNVGAHYGRLLFAFTPGGFEGYFEEIGHDVEPGTTPPPLEAADVDRSAEAAPRYGLRVVWSDPALQVER